MPPAGFRIDQRREIRSPIPPTLNSDLRSYGGILLKSALYEVPTLDR